ncbi:cytoplasmic dynein 2 light intermediate chain 1 isoform X2 [Petromyzon marinus]|uniref:cytoplasmic dynein 2 light intermediate chain 1 isoform X2 n=1 Tax=Petromyzon marinus TaxID=7757 RepID=UPI003F71087F
MSRQSDTIWDIALAEVKNRAGGQEGTGAGSAQPTESTVFFMGSRSAGKTTLIHRFQDRDDEPPKATTALEYAYSRHSRGQVKDVAHVWELGGGTFLTDLIKIFIVPSNLSSLSMVLVLDLSEPGQLWRTLDDLLRAARTYAVSAIAELAKTQKHAADALRQQAAERLGSEHSDKAMVDPFPLPLVIIGMKYDIFQNFDSEKRKAISKTMRFIAHYNVATLLENQRHRLWEATHDSSRIRLSAEYWWPTRLSEGNGSHSRTQPHGALGEILQGHISTRGGGWTGQRRRRSQGQAVRRVGRGCHASPEGPGAGGVPEECWAAVERHQAGVQIPVTQIRMHVRSDKCMCHGVGTLNYVRWT